MKAQAGFPQEPSAVMALDPEEFRFVLSLGAGAGEFKVPMESPAKYGVSVDFGRGDVRRFQFTEDPLNRFAFAVKEHFAGDVSKTAAFMWRWFAFQKVLDLPECVPYVQSAPEGGVYIHSSVTDAAATHPLNDSWEFDVPSFFRTVAELYAKDPN